MFDKPALLRSAVEKAAEQFQDITKTDQPQAACCAGVAQKEDKTAPHTGKVLHLKDLELGKVVGVTGARSNLGSLLSYHVATIRFHIDG